MGCLRGFLWRQEARWPKSDSCLLPASPSGFPGRCSLATEAVSVSVNSPSRKLLAILCLMRYEDWTFREAEVRLSEHRELRQVLGLASAPDFTTLYRFLQRLDDQTIDRAVGETVRRLRGSLCQGRKRARVAVDATGLAQGAVSTFFVRRMHHHGQKPLPWRHWLKWVVAVDLDQQFVLSQLARRGPWNDCANLPAVVEAAFRANAHRVGAGRRRVRQREKSYLYPQATRSAERHSRQAR